MQRFFIIALAVISLSVSPVAMATDPIVRLQWENVSEPQLVHHIALLLPLESPSFGEAANIVKEGFVTATMREQPLPFVIRLYATTDDPLDIFITYQQAVAAGAVFVVGPLTRDGVSAMASSKILEVPTLALNTVDNSVTLPSKLYLFGLQMETEASQIAKLALTSGKNRAIIISDDGALSKRLQAAFTEHWQSESGKTVELLRYMEDPAKLQQLRSLTTGQDHLIFLALDAAKSRTLRAYLDPDVPVYATSQVFTGDDNFLLNNDLNGIQFVDMPWLLQPDHPAVMAYRHTDKTRSTDMKRLYALGIDAFRLMTHLLQPQSVYDIAFDGVTGYIRFVPPNQFIREPVAAQFEQGKAQLINLQQNNTSHEGQ
ncbi:penicillin-binding protein activator [Nitrosomonas sp.]|uniref:penicillin-binding protein activator n=1 Tax=Nitrosomonas sp. TaxID=42353 RepID=UPI0026293550|nr:penicillin-binding protein activator [Nitrosomonas sp.]